MFKHRAGNIFRRWVVGLGCCCVLLAAVTTATAHLQPIGTILVAPLEARFAALASSLENRFDGIIALGGHPERVVEAVRLALYLPGAKLVIAGQGEERSHAYALGQGISPDQIVIEPHSGNTYENAVFSSRLLQPRLESRWLLVTSPAHMPRAVGSFRKAGFNVTPWPVTAVPQIERHTRQAAQHEWIGLVAYRVFGRTDALFPGPADQLRPRSSASLYVEASRESGADAATSVSSRKDL